MAIGTGEERPCDEPRRLVVAVVVGAGDLGSRDPSDLGRLIGEATANADSLIWLAEEASGDRGRLEALAGAAAAFATGTLPIRVEPLAGAAGLAAVGREAIDRRCDLLLVDADAIPCAGAFAEMRRVAADDSMTGFVVARGEGRGRYRLPVFAGAVGLERVAARLRAGLDERRRVAALDGPALLIRREVLAGFADLDDAEVGFGADFLLRAMRVGFGIALAERAWFSTTGEAAAAPTLPPIAEWHQRVVAARPELAAVMAAPLGGPRTRAEALWPALAVDRPGIAIDASGIARSFNGTTMLLLRLLPPLVAAAGERFAPTLVGDVEVLRHHGFDRIPGLALSTPAAARAQGFAAALRIGQPYDVATVADLAALGAVDVWFMLDTISVDCVQFGSDALERLWALVMRTAGGVIHNSDFTAARFRRRFEVGPRTATLVSRHSLKPSEYRLVEPAVAGDGSVLIVGNRFPHKFVAETYARLKARLPQRRFVVLGDGEAAVAEGDRAIASGRLGSEAIGGLYSAAEAVVFPSFYEGFGFPILEALAHRRPVFARDGRLGREIAAAVGSANLRLYEDEDEIAAMLAARIDWIEEPERSAHGWAASAAEIVAFLGDRIADARLADIERRFVELDRLRAELDAAAAAVSSDRRRNALIADGLGLALVRARLKRALSLVLPKRRAAARAEVEALKALLARFRDR